MSRFIATMLVLSCACLTISSMVPWPVELTATNSEIGGLRSASQCSYDPAIADWPLPLCRTRCPRTPSCPRRRAAARRHGRAVGRRSKGYRYLHSERQGAVFIARFYNPPTNLMNAPMVDEIRDLLSKVEADGETRVLIFTGGVPNIFIQHYDVGELKIYADAAVLDASLGSEGELKPIYRAFLGIEALSKPVIAAINGQAEGGGLEIALACDFRIMTNPGVVGLPEVNVGFMPGAGGTVRLPRLIGIARAKELIMLGKPIDADTAVRDGLVVQAVPPDQLMPEAMKLAERLASLPQASLALAKKLINTSGEMPLRDALRLEQTSFWELLRTAEAQHLIRRTLSGN
jgi:enoyl-CoA hydratase